MYENYADNNFYNLNNYNNFIYPYITEIDSYMSLDNYQIQSNNCKFKIINQEQFEISNNNKNKDKQNEKKFINLTLSINESFILTTFSISNQINEQFIPQRQEQVNLSEIENYQIKRGRKKKNDIRTRKRNQFCADNLMHRLKTLFYQKFLITFINAKIKKVFKEQKYQIIKINADIIKDIKSLLNLKLLEVTLKEFLSNKISIKFYRKNTNHNIIQMEKLLESDYKDEFKIIFNTQIIEFYNIFISKDSFNIIKKRYGFEFNSNYITLINKLDETFEYKEKLKNFCLNYVNYLKGNK
jgi:hypothetical protein